MKRAPLLVTLVSTLLLSRTSLADPYDPSAMPPGSFGNLPTWGTAHAINDATSVTRDAPVTRARELLTRSRFLDDAASVDEKAAAELTARLPALRAAAKGARERTERAGEGDKDLLGARADDLEADVIVSEAEVTFKRKTAADNRRAARDLRVRAVKLAREPASASEEPAVLACDPPFRFTADGRKIYRLECLK